MEAMIVDIAIRGAKLVCLKIPGLKKWVAPKVQHEVWAALNVNFL